MTQSLGKGLQSLIPKKESKITGLIKDLDKSNNWLKTKKEKESIFNVETDKIVPNPNQPRKELSEESLKELASSIREHGILQPLLVTKIEKATERGQQVGYELVAGERRWRAAQMVGLPHVPVIIRDSAADEKLELALVENIQRENLNAMELARAYKQLQGDFGLRHLDIGQKVGKSRTAITNTMRLLTLPPQVQQAMFNGQISEGHGRALLMARPQAQMPIFRTIIRNGLNVRQTEDRARKEALPDKPKGVGPKNPFFKKIEKDLRESLGRRVSILKRGDSNYINIEFANQKELDKIVSQLMKI
ncbi:MAG: ParB/RepB/Spo0J family partition protein [Patescibacteria group bacterium]